MTMLQITPETIADLKQILQAQKIESTNLRITARIGWGGMSFDLVLDEPGAQDTVEEHEGINFIVESNIVDKYGPFDVKSFKRGNQTYLDINSAQNNDGGGCDSCSTCG